MGSLDGRVAIVTGAGSGIGRAAAFAFAAAGASVLVVDVNDEHGEQTVKQLEADGCRAAYHHADVSRPQDADAMVAAALEQFGRLDCAFNNAGIEGEPAPFANFADDAWDRVIAVNLTGVFNCLRAELAHMSANGGGSIVNTASIAGLVGFPGSAAYVASKHAVVGLTKAAALDYAKQGVRVNALCPGVIDTDMIRRATEQSPQLLAQVEAAHPMGRIGRPEEVADYAVWLCSDEASFVTGQAIAVDGGYTTQ